VQVIEKTFPLHADCRCYEITHDWLHDTKKPCQREELFIGILLLLVPFVMMHGLHGQRKQNIKEEKILIFESLYFYNPYYHGAEPYFLGFPLISIAL